MCILAGCRMFIPQQQLAPEKMGRSGPCFANLFDWQKKKNKPNCGGASKFKYQLN